MCSRTVKQMLQVYFQLLVPIGQSQYTGVLDGDGKGRRGLHGDWRLPFRLNWVHRLHPSDGFRDLAPEDTPDVKTAVIVHVLIGKSIFYPVDRQDSDQLQTSLYRESFLRLEHHWDTITN